MIHREIITSATLTSMSLLKQLEYLIINRDEIVQLIKCVKTITKYITPPTLSKCLRIKRFQLRVESQFHKRNV